jgi:hypothetical protein
MSQAQMAIAVTTRLDKLNVAAALHGFDKALNRSAWGSLGWGMFSALIGAILLYSTSHFGWVNIVIGLLLVVEGIYEKRVREPKVIKISAATLGLLGLWNLGGFILAVMASSRVVGHPWVGVLQLIGAWNTYKGYATYAALLSASDPGTNAEFEALFAQVTTVDPSSAPDVVEFTSAKFGSNDVRWRVRLVDGLMFFLGNEVVFGRKKSQPTCFFIPRQQVRLEIMGEKMFGSKQKAVVTAGGLQLKATIAPEMAQKLVMLLG